MVEFKTDSKVTQNLVAAIKSGDEAQQAAAWQAFHESLVQTMRRDFEDWSQSQDDRVLARRGYRQLTGEEHKFYQQVISALKSANPKQEFAAIDAAGMPTTIIEDVYKHLQEQHPLMAAVNFTYTSYVTEWILPDHTRQKAVWGEITDEITKEITSAFKVVPVTLAKLSAFAVVSRGMLDLGPTFLDSYVRTCLAESIYCGFEAGIVSGSGNGEMVGMDRNIAKGATFTEGSGYAQKTAVKVTDFTPASYGALVARVVKTEDGRMRNLAEHTLGLVCNQLDYLTRIMPATTLLTSAGSYARDLFPVPTTVFICNEVAEGEALLGVMDDYNALVSSKRNGTVEFDDSVRFLQDQRAFKVVQYANGRPYDNTSFIRLDISALDPAFITVATKGGAAESTGGQDSQGGQG